LPLLAFAQIQRSNTTYLFPGYLEYPAQFSNPQKLNFSLGNRSLLGPFNNIQSYYVAGQYNSDSLRHGLGLMVNTEKEGDLIRNNRVHGQYSYTITLNEYWKWKLGASLGFYNLVLEGTSSTGSLSAWTLRNAVATAFQYKKHQFATVFQDIGSPKVYNGVQYKFYSQSMLEMTIFNNPFRDLKAYYFNRINFEDVQHDVGWKLTLGRYFGFGHLIRFRKGNSFMINGEIPFSEDYQTNLQFIYNSPVFSKLTQDFQSIEIRLQFSRK
jgi:hypothetical protein